MGDAKHDQIGHVPDYFVERFSQIRIDEKASRSTRSTPGA